MPTKEKPFCMIIHLIYDFTFLFCFFPIYRQINEVPTCFWISFYFYPLLFYNTKFSKSKRKFFLFSCFKNIFSKSLIILINDFFPRVKVHFYSWILFTKVFVINPTNTPPFNSYS